MYRLVVIDDEYIVVQGIKALLSRLKLDYEVVGAAYDGIQGLEVIRNEKPDVVIKQRSSVFRGWMACLLSKLPRMNARIQILL